MGTRIKGSSVHGPSSFKRIRTCALSNLSEQVKLSHSLSLIREVPRAPGWRCRIKGWAMGLKARDEQRYRSENAASVLVERPPIPTNMMVELTNGCNHACVFCTNS